jgi:diacylglycerol kinase (ATP)
MRVTLVHNPTAGDGSPSRDELLDHLRAAGHDPVYSTAERMHVKRALEEPGDVVLVAGGDGTVAKVARRLARRDVPMSILPLGTSNNIASSLGVRGSVRDIIAGLRDAKPRRLDLPTARGPWGKTTFVESAGVGAFAEMLRNAERADPSSNESKAPHRTRGRGLQEALAAARGRHRRVEVDGEDRSGTYLLVVALNTRFVGPHLELVPEADPGDGQLDVVFIRERDRAAVDEYLSGLPSGRAGQFPLPAIRARCIRLAWEAEAGHIDDELWPAEADVHDRDDHEDEDDENALMVDLEMIRRPLQVLVAELS